MTIYVQVSDGNRITIQKDEDCTIHLGSQNHGVNDQEPIMKSGCMTWKAGMYLLTITSSHNDVPEENKLYLANLMDAHENHLAEIVINKATYEFFRDHMDEAIAQKEQVAEGFD